MIHDDLDLLERYLTETATEKYQWGYLNSVFDTFAPTLHDHLNGEIQILLSLESILEVNTEYGVQRCCKSLQTS